MPNQITDKWGLLLNSFNKDNAILVQIGANDGVSHGDEVLYHMIQANPQWQKILIEPVEENMNLLKDNYKDCQNVFFEKIAIGEADSKKEMYINTIGNDGGLFGALSTFNEDIALKFFSNVSFKKEDIDVRHFSYVVDKYKISRIDIFQSDTEGYDGLILNQIFDLNIFPKILKVESGFMTHEEANRILAILNIMNYDILEFSPDLIALRLI